MEDVTVSELRDRLDELLDRVEAGETIRVTRNGRAITELRPLVSGPKLTGAEILERFRRLQPVDLEEFRRDVDAVIDPYA